VGAILDEYVGVVSGMKTPVSEDPRALVRVRHQSESLLFRTGLRVREGRRMH